MLTRFGLIPLLPVVTTLLGQDHRIITRLPLVDGGELRILRVSLETNYIPSTQSPGTPWVTRYDSLVVGLEKVHPASGHSSIAPEQVEARLPDGSFARGEARAFAGVAGNVEFRLFDRKAQQVPLRYRDGTNLVSFVVGNPRPTTPAPWTAKAMPQTNQVSQTKFILSAVSAYAYRGSGPKDNLRITASARTLEGNRTGWMYWRVIGFDSSGNWSEPSWGRSSRLPFLLPMLSVADAPWKLCIEAEEYISAGFIPPPTNGSYIVCTPDARAQSLGVVFLMVADRGSYFVTNGIVTRQIETSIYTPPSVTWSGRDNWSLQLVIDRPGIVCLSERTTGLSSIRARVRERLPDDEGRIFATAPNKAIQFPVASNLALGLFPIALPSVTTNLEAEIIALHQPAEFFVNPPSQ